MRKISIMIIVVIMTSLGCLCGCTEFEKDVGEALEGDVIHVGIYAYGDVYNNSGISLQGLQVQFDLIKTGGADFTYSVDIESTGRVLCPYVSYNLHEGETIYVTAAVIGIDGGGDSATLTFSSAIQDATPFGDGQNTYQYQWEPYFIITI
jgi:hypothetical protein